jgi:uncharacterized protein YdeI (YjbR/CyaY-like superfamily)
MHVLFFPSTTEFRQWLSQNYKTEKEAVVGFYKVSTGKPSMTWSESVDVALCYGWIDGIRRSIDAESYCIRFTPRNPKSVWSKINIAKVEKLIQEGWMTDAGLEAYSKRNDEKSGIYSFENGLQNLSEAYEKRFKANVQAWEFFSRQSPSYRKVHIYWIMSAKQEQTRLNRLEKLIQAASEGKKLF